MTVQLPALPDNYLKTLPQIRAEEIQILWHCAFYDGPRDGVVMYQTRPYWFTLREDAEDFRISIDAQGQKWSEWYTRFVVIELSDAQFMELKAQNELFREKVGTHWDYEEQGKRVQGSVKPQESSHEYYDVARTWPPIDLSHNGIVGWFEWLFKRVEED